MWELRNTDPDSSPRRPNLIAIHTVAHSIATDGVPAHDHLDTLGRYLRSLGGLPLNDKAAVCNHSAGAGYWFHARALCTQCGGNRFRAIFRYMSARNVRRVRSAHSSPARFDDASGETCRQILQISRAHGITWMPNWSRELPCFCVALHQSVDANKNNKQFTDKYAFKLERLIDINLYWCNIHMILKGNF